MIIQLNVPKRVMVVVKILALRGLPFRGDNSTLRNSNNGNFLMALKIIV